MEYTNEEIQETVLDSLRHLSILSDTGDRECKDCTVETGRFPGCHAVCSSYAKYRKGLDEKNAEVNKQKEAMRYRADVWGEVKSLKAMERKRSRERVRR